MKINLPDGSEINLKYIKKVCDRHGVELYYHRKTGARLPDDPNTTSFHDAWKYQQSLLDAPATSVKPVLVSSIESLDDLIRAYKVSPDFLEGNRASTRSEKERHFNTINKKFGLAPLEIFTDKAFSKDVRDWHRSLGSSPAVANRKLAALSSVMSWAVREYIIESNPCAGIQQHKEKSRAKFVWTDEDLVAFMAVPILIHKTNNRKVDDPTPIQELVHYAYHTAARQDDIFNTGPQDRKKNIIKYVNSKTGSDAIFPIHPDILTHIDSVSANDHVYFRQQNGNAWNRSAFSSAFDRTRARAVGMNQELQFRDLRGTAISRWAAQGLTAIQIATMTGHAVDYVNTIIEHYLDRGESIADAIGAMWNAQ